MRRLFFYSQSSSRTGPLIIKRCEVDWLVRLEVISFIFYSCLALTLKNTLIFLIFTVFEGRFHAAALFLL